MGMKDNNNNSEISLGSLGVLATETLFTNLKNYGNNLSRKHKIALTEIISGYGRMAIGMESGRIAFPLACGGGKTQSIVAWLHAVHRLGYLGIISVAISQSKVQSLCELKRDLAKSGIPEELIGLRHSYQSMDGMAEGYLNHGIEDEDGIPDGYAWLPNTENNQDKPILLCTHNRVKAKRNSVCGIEEFSIYKGQPRSLMMWDESMIRSESRGIPLLELQKGYGAIKPDLAVKENASFQSMVTHIGLAVKKFESELKNQQNGKDPEYVKLPKLTHEEIVEFKAFLNPKDIYQEPLRYLLDISPYDLRIIDTGSQGIGVIQYDILIPNELSNIIILDASHRIRDLCNLDPTIKETHKYQVNIVSYRNVEIYQIKHPSGRASISNAFMGRNGKSKDLIMEYVDIVRSIPDNEGVIFFVFKPKGKTPVDTKEILQEALTDSCINVYQIITDEKGNTMPRFVFINHGNENSVSKYSGYKNEIWVGVLHRNRLELASKIAGQRDNLLENITTMTIAQIERSECAYCFHQGFNRSACRRINNGIAEASRIYITYPDDKIRPLINQVMPDVRWFDYQTKHLKQRASAQSIARRIASYLSQQGQKYSQGETAKPISTRRIKGLLDLKEIPNETFRNAIKLVLESTHDWIRQDKSLVYKDASWYGF